MKMLQSAAFTAGLCASLASAGLLSPTKPSHNLDNVQIPVLQDPDPSVSPASQISSALQDVLDALSAMQATYFDTFAGTWADAIDWTAAVTGTHVSATLSAIVDGLDLQFPTACADLLQWENLVNEYYTQIAFYYFGENVFGLRNQAYDDMLWVVLGWLESTKFAHMYDRRHGNGRTEMGRGAWHGLQLSPMAAHRARIFYELASQGWDEELCDGGMTWNPSLTPYKNAITNELFVAASIEMYLHFPGDNNSAPFLAGGVQKQDSSFYDAHDPIYLENAVKGYKWLKASNMRNSQGLYADGYHVTGWHRYPNGTIDRGTGNCDELNTMVYTYNQGVLLTANRGLWLATGATSYLDDGHDLVSAVIRATGWPNKDKQWRGLGRGGVLEEYCDHELYCSQDGQTFKGIFFHHLVEFCRPLRESEKELLTQLVPLGYDPEVYKYHLARCAAYGKWIEHNADAALATRNEDGLFGMWWGIPYQSPDAAEWEKLAKDKRQHLPEDAVDHLNPIPHFRTSVTDADLNDRGRGRTVETQGGGLAAVRAKWMWQALYS